MSKLYFEPVSISSHFDESILNECNSNYSNFLGLSKKPNSPSEIRQMVGLAKAANNTVVWTSSGAKVGIGQYSVSPQDTFEGAVQRILGINVSSTTTPEITPITSSVEKTEASPSELLDLYNEGIREKKEGIDEIGKINWLKQNIGGGKAESLIRAYLAGRNYDIVNSDLYSTIKSYYDEGIREQKENIWEGGKLNWIKANEKSKESLLFVVWYLKGRKDGSEGKYDFPTKYSKKVESQDNDEVVKPKPPKTTWTSESKNDEESSSPDYSAKTSEKKFLGMPKNIGIGVTTVAGLAIIGFVAWKIIKK